MDRVTSPPAVQRLDRRDVVSWLLEDRQDLLVVTGLGAPTYDCAAAGDHPNNFYLWGAMGGAAMVGLGLAIAQPQRPVLVLTGDGEQLMGMGSLATIAVRRPPNLAIVVLDNERYGETGGQRTHTAHGTDLAAIARGCGIGNSQTLRAEAQVRELRVAVHSRRETLFAAIMVGPEDLPRVLPPRDGVHLAHRFRQSVLGETF
ncbi:MAG TPA: thiamine pyrophosphate-dependent enzyme [Burkholderiaceae bacterium]|nr:thiamine pyrophosphate-dependent enzyme [Burkholderiaceae bacterium]